MMAHRITKVWEFCLEHQTLILGIIGWLIIALAYPVGSQLPTYAEY